MGCSRASYSSPCFFGKNHKHSSRTTVKQKGLSRRSVVAIQDRQTEANPEATRYSIPGKKTQKSKASMRATQEATFEQNRHQFPSVSFLLHIHKSRWEVRCQGAGRKSPTKFNRILDQRDWIWLQNQIPHLAPTHVAQNWFWVCLHELDLFVAES
jgi:hypothetical protein